MVCDKVRIRFRKAGDLRLVSHHDLMRCFERMLRRAAIPFHSTAGFNPKPRLIFALSLGLGIVGCREVADLELDAVLPPEEIHRCLAQQSPAGLEILEVCRINPKASAQVRSVSYRLQVPPERLAALPERAAALLAAPEAWVERTRPQSRRFDLRPYLKDLRIGTDDLQIDLYVTPTGTARADEVLTLLGLADLLEAGAVLDRTNVELQEDILPAPELQAAGRESNDP